MDEHDDDLESVVHEVAEKELDGFPDVSEELTEPLGDASSGETEEQPLDDDDDGAEI